MKKPHVIIDARMLGMGGIGRYVGSLVRSMAALRPDIRWTLVGDPVRIGRIPGVEARECRTPIYSAAEWFGLHKYFADADLAHFPHFNAPASCGPGTVVTVHDLIHFEVPEYQPFPGANRLLDWRLRLVLKRADAVLAVSEATAAAVRDRYPIPGLAQKMSVTLEAAEAIFDAEARRDDAARVRDLGVDEPYFLYVGAIREHKGTDRLVRAFMDMRERSVTPARLVLAGKVDPRFDRKHGFLGSIGRRNDITLLTDATDEQLAVLYRRTAAVVLPSRVEGFGLPVVEAMRSGAPVILSDIPSLKEVAGPAALYFAPDQIDALAQHLYNVLHDPGLRDPLVRAGIERSRVFNWSHTARATLSAYEPILQKK